MRRRLAATALVSLALSALAGLAAGRAASTDGLVASPVGAALVSADGRRVTVTETGPCLGAGLLRAREETNAVVLGLRVVPRDGGCLGGAQLLVQSVDLAAPLGRRTLVDAATGSILPVFDAADLFRATVLPPGYRFAYVAPGYASGGGAGGSPASQWAPAASSLFVDPSGGSGGGASGGGASGGGRSGAGRSSRLWLVEEYGRHWPDGWPTDPPLVGAAGSLARVGPNGLAWQTRTPDGTPVSLALLSDTPVPTNTLVTVADGLQPVANRTPPGDRPGNR